MSSPRALTLGDVVLVARGADFRAVTNMSGWDDSPAVRSSIQTSPGRDGGWDGAGYFDPRVVAVSGIAAFPNHAAACNFRDSLSSLTPHELVELAVDDGEATRSAQVRLNRGTVFTWVNNVSLRFDVEVIAPDPTKYGPAAVDSTSLAPVTAGTGLVFPLAFPLDFGAGAGVTPGAVLLSNTGTASYWPRLQIDGPVTNPMVTLNDTGDFVRFAGVVAAGQWLEVDLAARRVLLNGQVSVMHKVTFAGSWLAVPPGGASMSWTADDADPAALLTVWSFDSAWS